MNNTLTRLLAILHFAPIITFFKKQQKTNPARVTSKAVIIQTVLDRGICRKPMLTGNKIAEDIVH